jgi:hypothetical protein
LIAQVVAHAHAFHLRTPGTAMTSDGDKRQMRGPHDGAIQGGDD